MTREVRSNDALFTCQPTRFVLYRATAERPDSLYCLFSKVASFISFGPRKTCSRDYSLRTIPMQLCYVTHSIAVVRTIDR